MDLKKAEKLERNKLAWQPKSCFNGCVSGRDAQAMLKQRSAIYSALPPVSYSLNRITILLGHCLELFCGRLLQ